MVNEIDYTGENAESNGGTIPPVEADTGPGVWALAWLYLRAYIILVAVLAAIVTACRLIYIPAFAISDNLMHMLNLRP
jgi:hypothetical protein